MDKKIWLMALLLAVALFAGVKDSEGAITPSCNYLLIAPSNVSSGVETNNQTLKVVIETNTNQTDDSNTFIRLSNDETGYAYFTNQTASVVNRTDGTALYSIIYSQLLDETTYKVSAAFFYLNNTRYNYTATQANCVNSTFIVKTTEGFVGQVGIQAAEEQAGVSKPNYMMLILLIASLILVIFLKEK